MKLGFGAWRLFLALLVALSHLWVDMLPGPAAYAVWGFFVLSGYLMTHVLQNKYGFSLHGLQGYARNRFIRIVPGFWVACVLGAVVLWWLDRQGVDARKLNPAFGVPRDSAEWGFLLTLLPSFPRWNAPVPVANALSIEVGFYLLMPLLAQHRSSAWLALLLGCFIVADHGLSHETFGPRYAWFLPSAPAFALGALVCHYRDELARIASPRISVVLWIGQFAIFWHDTYWPWTYGLYVSGLLSAWVVLSLSSRRTGRLDDALGELSYPCYLLHATAGALLLAWFGYDRSASFALAALALTWVGCWAMVRLIDRPLLRFKRKPRLVDATPPPESSAAAVGAALPATG